MKNYRTFECKFCRWSIFDEEENYKSKLCNKCKVKHEDYKLRMKQYRKDQLLKSKKNLDYLYVAKLISRRDKISIESITEEMILLTRESLRLKQYIKDTFTCKVHGKLTRKDYIKVGKLRNGSTKLACKFCRKIIRDKNYKQHKQYKEDKIVKDINIGSITA